MQTYDVTDDLRQLADDLRAELARTTRERDGARERMTYCRMLAECADDEVLADAIDRLVAQRDELLALLKEMVDGCDEDETDATWLAESRAAIAKAAK